MKRILSVITIFALGMIITVASFAQTDAGTSEKPLTPNQWKRGIAIVGQNAALDGRYGHPENEFPVDYTLDDLNQVYKNSKWKAVYSALKGKESSPGTIQDLKDIASEYTQPNGVVRKLNDYIATHPDKQSPASPASSTAQPAGDTPVPETDAAQPDSIMVINATADNAANSETRGVGMIIDIVLFIIAALALYLAFMTRRENAELKKELDYKTKKIASQFEKFSKNITTDLNRVTYKVNKRRASEGDSSISFNEPDSPANNADTDESPEAVVEPKKYYLAKPDSNDYFMRATEELEIGNSIYELCTFDGITGTYRVIDNADVHHFALMMPTENLVRACTGNGIQISNGKSRIVTDRDGTARCENGRWHVAVKAIIHYEA
ncbi:MAG: hypothetical protein ACI4AH_04890 [Muribaculaceae bacterium]